MSFIPKIIFGVFWAAGVYFGHKAWTEIQALKAASPSTTASSAISSSAAPASSTSTPAKTPKPAKAPKTRGSKATAAESEP